MKEIFQSKIKSEQLKQKPDLDDKFEKVLKEANLSTKELKKEFVLQDGGGVDHRKILAKTIEELEIAKNPLEKMREILDRKKLTSLLAVSLWHLERTSSEFPHKDIEKRESIFREKRKDYFPDAEHFARIIKGSAEHWPAWCAPFLLAAFGETTEKMPERERKEMIASTIKSVSRMFSAIDKGSLVWKKFVIGEDWIRNKKAEEKFRKEFQNGMIRHHDSSRFLLTAAEGEEFLFHPSYILRPLARKGLLNWGELLEKGDREEVKSYTETYLKGSIYNELKMKEEKREDTSEPYLHKSFEFNFPVSSESKKLLLKLFGNENLGLSGSYEMSKEMETGEYKSTGFAFSPKFGEFSMPPIIKSGTFGWREMPLKDFRLNFEVIDKKDIGNWSKILGGVYAESFLEGWPIMSKTTAGDIGKSRVINYADYYTLLHLLEKIEKRDLNPLSKKEDCLPKGSGDYMHLFPFGKEIPLHVRKTGETMVDDIPEKQLSEMAKKFPSSELLKIG